MKFFFPHEEIRRRTCKRGKRNDYTLLTQFLFHSYEYQIFDCIISLHLYIRTHELVVNRMVRTNDELNILSVYMRILT